MQERSFTIQAIQIQSHFPVFSTEENPVQHASPEEVQLSKLRFVFFPYTVAFAMDHSESGAAHNAWMA